MGIWSLVCTLDTRFMPIFVLVIFWALPGLESRSTPPAPTDDRDQLDGLVTLDTSDHIDRQIDPVTPSGYEDRQAQQDPQWMLAGTGTDQSYPHPTGQVEHPGWTG